MANECVHQISRHTFQKVFVLAQQVRLPLQHTDGSRRQPRDDRKEFLPDPIAVVERLLIARITTIGQPFMIQVCHHLLAGGCEKRTNNPIFTGV